MGPPLARPPPVSEAGQGQRFIYATGSVRRAPRDCDGFNDGADDDGCVLGGGRMHAGHRRGVLEIKSGWNCIARAWQVVNSIYNEHGHIWGSYAQLPE